VPPLEKRTFSSSSKLDEVQKKAARLIGKDTPYAINLHPPLPHRRMVSCLAVMHRLVYKSAPIALHDLCRSVANVVMPSLPVTAPKPVESLPSVPKGTWVCDFCTMVPESKRLKKLHICVGFGPKSGTLASKPLPVSQPNLPHLTPIEFPRGKQSQICWSKTFIPYITSIWNSRLPPETQREKSLHRFKKAVNQLCFEDNDTIMDYVK
jgi:hypothetical protein